MKKQREEQVEINNQFLEILRLASKGEALDQASKGLAQVMYGVSLTGKKGKLTIECIVSDEEPACSIAFRVKVDIPKAMTRKMMLYLTEDGGISRKDPDQEEMKPIVVEAEAETHERASAAS